MQLALNFKIALLAHALFEFETPGLDRCSTVAHVRSWSFLCRLQSLSAMHSN
jgi:hypothetical protein